MAGQALNLGHQSHSMERAAAPPNLPPKKRQSETSPETQKLEDLEMLELANRKNAPTAIKGPRPGELGFHIVLPPMSPQYPTKDLHSPLPIPHMASVPQMGIFGGPIHDHGQSPPRRGQLGSFSIIPTNSIRRKPLHGDLKGQYKYQLPHMGGSMRTIQAQMKPSALRKAKSTLLTRVESMQFREAKENSWKRAQEWGYAWARGDGTQTPQRVGHTGGLTEKQFMQLMDERKKAAIRERARQVAEYEYELRMAGEALDQAQDSQEQASTFSSKRVKFSSDNDEKVAAIGAAAEPMDEDNNEEEDAYDDDCDDDDDDDDDNLDDYNLELQCSSSESEGVGPASAASSVTNDEDHEPEDEQIVEDDETEGDEEIGDEEDDEELGENGIGGESSIEDGSDIDEDTPIPQENVPLPVGLKASENNKGMQAYCKVDDDGSKALAALILTDPVPVDLRQISNTAFNKENDKWLLEMVPYYQAMYSGTKAWDEIHENFFLRFFIDISIPCLRARYALLEQAAPLVGRRGENWY